MIKNYGKYTHKNKNDEQVVMIIRAETECSECGYHETLYIDEKACDTVEHYCHKCGNNCFIIKYKC